MSRTSDPEERLLTVEIALSLAFGLTGVIVGAFLFRRNARRDHADKLLADALNDLVSAVAGGDLTGQRRYASATSRVVLHGSPALVAAFEDFQLDATTGTPDGRRRFIAAVQLARRELGRGPVNEKAAATLFFGSDRDARSRIVDGTKRARPVE